MKQFLCMLLPFVFFVSPTLATAETYKVARSLKTTGSSHDVWKVIGDFCDIDDWHPVIATCDLKVIDGSLHRVLTTADGAEFVEKRIASEQGLSYTYSIVSSPLPLDRYTGTLSVTAGDATTVTWSTNFSTDDPSIEGFIGGVFDAGIAQIEAMLAK